MAKISISLERNNIGKGSRINAVDEMIRDLEDGRLNVLIGEEDTLEDSFKFLCKLPQQHQAWIDKFDERIAILDNDRAPMGGIAYESNDSHISTRAIKLLPKAQGKGLVQALLEYLVKSQGGIYSSSSISPGAALLFKKLSDRYGGYLVWSKPKTYAAISSWKPRGIYKVFPSIKAPDGKEYPVDELELSVSRLPDRESRLSIDWKYSEIWIGKNGQPPKGFKQLNLTEGASK